MKENLADFERLIKKDTVSVAKDLLGRQLLLNGESLGLIVETEAYLGIEDSGCHSFEWRRTPKNEAMYLPAGHWYVYQIYGHYLLNFVTGTEEEPEAVLIRALEIPSGGGNGPGKFTKICEIDKRFNGQNVLTSSLSLSEKIQIPRSISLRPRIGMNCSEPWHSAKLGFYVAGHSQVSKIRKSEIIDQPWK